MEMVSQAVYIGLGSNLSDPALQLTKALEAIAALQQVEMIKASSFYQTAAIGPAGQPDYLNAVVLIQTTLSAENLLDRLQEIENDQGRIRQQKWGARTLDLDILLFGEHEIHSERLTVPHEQMTQRNFVLKPLHEIAGDELFIPGSGKLGDVIRECPENPITKWQAHQAS